MKGRPRLALFLGLAVVGVAVFLLANTLRAGPAVQRLAMDKTISSWSSASGLEVSAHLVRDEIENAGPCDIDYVVVRDAETLAAVDTVDRPCVALVAVRIAGTRLIDNTLLEP